MARSQPPPDPRARGFLRAWVSGALLWSTTTKRLLESNGFGEAQLAIVALYLCVHEAVLLINGKRRIDGDKEARADCPIEPNDLEDLRDRLERFRNEVLHLSDKTQEGRAVHTRWTADPPHFVFESSVGDRGELEWDSISRADIEGWLTTLDPWLHRHWGRLVHEEFDEVTAATLRAKIDETMTALADLDAG